MPSELSVIEASGAAVVDKTILPFGQTVHLSLAANTEGFAFVFMQSPSVKGTVIWQGAVGIKPQILMKDPLKDVIGIPLMEAGDYSFCSIAAPTLEALTMLRDILNRGIQQPDLQVALSCLKIKVTEPL